MTIENMLNRFIRKIQEHFFDFQFLKPFPNMQPSQQDCNPKRVLETCYRCQGSGYLKPPAIEIDEIMNSRSQMGSLGADFRRTCFICHGSGISDLILE